MIEKLCPFFFNLFHLVERMVRHTFGKKWTKVKVTNVNLTFEPIIIETSDWHQNVSNLTYYHMGKSYLTLVQ